MSRYLVIIHQDGRPEVWEDRPYPDEPGIEERQRVVERHWAELDYVAGALNWGTTVQWKPHTNIAQFCTSPVDREEMDRVKALEGNK